MQRFQSVLMRDGSALDPISRLAAAFGGK